MKKFFTLGALLCCLTGTYAQITITQADFAQPDDTIWYSYDTLNVTSNLSTTAGANMTWNFATATNDENAPTWFLDPANSPVTPPPNITHVLVEKDLTGVSFLNVTAAGVTTVQANPAAFLGGPAFISLKSLTFPLQYQSVTNDSASSQVIVEASNLGLGTLFDSVQINFKVKLNSLCDGWGTLITPKGSYNSIRLKNTVNVTFKFFGKTKLFGTWVAIPVSTLPLPIPEQQKEVNYMWIGTNSKYVLAQATMITDSETERENFFYQTDKPVTSGLTESVKNNLRVSAYPNPASGETHISFSLNKAQQVTIQLYDITGRQVSTLQQACNAGDNSLALNLNNLAAGMYTAHITGADQQGVVKLSIAK